MSGSSRSRVLAVAVEAAILVSLFGGPAAIAAEPPDPASPTPTEVVEVAPDPSVEPSAAPTGEHAVEPLDDPVADPTTEPAADPAPVADSAPKAEPLPVEDPTPAEPTTVPPTEPVEAPRTPAEVAPEYVGTIETTTTLVAAPAEVVPGGSVTWTATVAPNPQCGSVTFTYNASPIDVPLDGNGEAQVTVPALAGTTSATADFLGCGEYSSSSDTADVVARYPSEAYLESSHETAVQYETAVTLTGYVWGPVDPTGSVTFARLVSGNPVSLATVALVDGMAILERDDLPVGTYEIVLTFPGDVLLKPAVSDPVLITITGDVSVKVSGVGVQYARFYPMKDGYKDTDQVRGTTLEPATVTIRIYHSNGTRVKSWSLGTRDGAYSVTWTGRRTDGSVLPAATYKVKQYFKDARGNTKTIVKDVYLSPKKLYWYTRSQTRYADTGVFYASGSAGAYRSTRFSHGALLDGGWYDDEAVLARYAFSLPGATIYKSLRLSVYGKSISPYGQGGMMLYNYADGGYDGEHLLGYSTNWYSSSVGASGHVSGGKVRAYVWAVGANYGLVDYQKVKLTYKYAVLK